VIKGLLITSLIGALIGSASAGFLISLVWVTTYRENHSWIIAFLPVPGLVIGLFYCYWGEM